MQRRGDAGRRGAHAECAISAITEQLNLPEMLARLSEGSAFVACKNNGFVWGPIKHESTPSLTRFAQKETALLSPSIPVIALSRFSVFFLDAERRTD